MEQKRVWKSWLGYLIMTALLVMLVVSWWGSYHWLEVSRETVASGRVDGVVRLAVLSDLHTSEFGPENAELAALVHSEAPDAVLMVGDMINEDATEVSGLLRLTETLAQECPVYYALGNHELECMETWPELERELEAAGAQVLDQEFLDVELAGQAVRIGGMYEYAFSLWGADPTAEEAMDPEIYGFLEEFQDTDRLRILMAHRPDSFIFGGAGEAWEIDLVVSGHAHGGQVRLPFVGGLWAPDQGWFPEYVDGVHDLGQVTLVVSRGLGSQPEALPRWGNRPEVLMVEVIDK